MHRINYGRVIGGGLLAGVILNVGEYILNEVIIGERWYEVLDTYGIDRPGTGVMVLYVIMTLILGIALVWLYAAIRPRFGPGPSTGICAGLFVWFLIWVWSLLGGALWGFFPRDLIAITVIWGLVEVLVAAVAGAWVYQEEESAAPPM